MSALYLHIPFCTRKCFYCDFYSIGARRAPWQQLVEALLHEAELRHGEIEPPSTLYIGGGTPSLIPQAELQRLIFGLKEIFDFSRVEEFTIEVNPDDVTPEFVDTMLHLGINRVSMGIQSFSDAELKAIGRRHTAARAIQAYEMLRPVGNISIDLIFGLPGQTMEQWKHNVEQALRLRPHHISAYSLMWEEGTPLSIMREQGRTSEIDEELSNEMFSHLSEQLRAAGYEQYEISNYALPDYHSRHNSSYWTGASYLGLGPSAHSYDGQATRYANPADVEAYLQHFNSYTDAPFAIAEHLQPHELREEMIMTRLRTARGLDTALYEARYGTAALCRLMHDAQPFINTGALSLSQQRHLHLTSTGIMIADTIISTLF